MDVASELPPADGASAAGSPGAEVTRQRMQSCLLGLAPAVLRGPAAMLSPPAEIARLVAAAAAAEPGSGSGTSAAEWRVAAADAVRVRASRMQPGDLARLLVLLGDTLPVGGDGAQQGAASQQRLAAAGAARQPFSDGGGGGGGDGDGDGSSSMRGAEVDASMPHALLLPAAAAAALTAANCRLANAAAPALAARAATLPEGFWAPLALSLVKLGHHDATTYGALADAGCASVRPSWAPATLVALLRAYARVGCRHGGLLAAAARALNLRASSLSPPQLVDAAEALAGFTAAAGHVPGTAGRTPSGGGPAEGPAAAACTSAAAGSDASSSVAEATAREGYGAGGGASVWTEGWAARSPPALQLHRALSLQAHQRASELSMEQLLRLLRASLAAGLCHSLLFRDAARR
eukprot:87057-Chlamydomonas_euryale.AAC.1